MRFPTIRLCVVFWCLLVATTSAEEIRGWGKAIDPTGKCDVALVGGKLKMTLPAGVYDHWFGRPDAKARFNAPRVLREVTGDFTATVKVTSPLQGKARDDDGYAAAAGLIALASDLHYLRLERNGFVPSSQPGVNLSWTPPLYDRDAKRVSTWRSGKQGMFKDEFTWLRMKRTGQKFYCAFSHDGEKWTDLPETETELPETIELGVLAITYSAAPLVAEFEEFKVQEN